MKLTTTIRENPDPKAKNVDGLESRVITAEADDYDAAFTALQAQVPQGWQMLGII